MILAQACGCLLNYRALRREALRHNIPITYSGWTTELPVLWRFSMPAVLGSLLMGPVTWACSAMLVRQPHGYEEMGVFNAANQWFSALMWLPAVLGQVILPMLAERFGANDQARSAKLLITAIKINAVVVLPLVLIGSLVSPYIMIAFGSDFAREWPTLIAVLITAGLVAVQGPVGQVIASSGRMWLGFAMNLAWALTFLCGSWLLLAWGSLGLASARLLAYVVQGIWALAYAFATIRSMRTQKRNELL